VLRKWDFGRKIFASQQHPDLIGYCGDVLFPSQTLSQIIEIIDRNAFFPVEASPQYKLQLIVAALERAACEYPSEETRDFSIVYGTRVGDGLSGAFKLSIVSFSAGTAKSIKPVEVTSKSGVLITLGSGTSQYKSYLSKWQTSEIGGTSRAVFASFCEFLRSDTDPKTGGAPQLAGLFRKASGRSFGIVWNDKLHLMGMELGPPKTNLDFDCYNDLFELCDGATLKRFAGAQRQPSPFSRSR
jgi:hypothetical protein